MALGPLRPSDPPSYGPYRLQSRLGAGGMGVVYLAFGPDGVSETAAVALKVLQPMLAEDEEYRARFVREVGAARLVDSPYVARVVAAETQADTLWMATEYVEGATLARAVDSNGPVPGDRLHGLASDLASALQALHLKGVVHRDLKPANVVLAWSGPKLIDFGIAKQEGATDLTQAGATVGSLLWMSPEVLAGYPGGRPSDIFAWGMCVAFAGTGRPPFGAGDAHAVGYRISREPPDLRGLPRGLTDLVAAALSKEPNARPSARDLCVALGVDQTQQMTAVAIPSPEGGWTGPRGAATTQGIAPGQPLTPPPPNPPPGWPGSPDGGANGSPAGSKRPKWLLPVAIVAGLVVIGGIVAGILAATGGKSHSAGPTPSPLVSPTSAPSSSPSTSPPPTSTPPTSAPPTSTAPVLASLSQAESVVKDDGYTPYSDSASNWDPTAPINVILGTLTGSADGFNNWAFFFAGNTFIGHDTSDPSAQISVFGRTNNVITLSYQLFAPNDPLCCPTAPSQAVRFQYLDGVLTPLDPIPPSGGSGNHR